MRQWPHHFNFIGYFKNDRFLENSNLEQKDVVGAPSNYIKIKVMRLLCDQLGVI